MAKLGEALGKERLYACFCTFGFGQRTGIHLPGEAEGILRPLNKWTSYSVTSVPVGQEIAVTPLQLVVAFSAIANDGALPPPRVVRAIIDSEGQVIKPRSQEATVVLEPRIAKTMRREIMRRVVEEGTGRRAELSRWSIAGKTGTAQKAVPGGYSHTEFISSFIGMAPAEEPRAIVLVMIDEPHKGGNHYGGTVAAPVVARIFERILAYLQVEPKGLPLQMARY
jgi:cell division protein FtsI/penicillin-binding protein 2